MISLAPSSRLLLTLLATFTLALRSAPAQGPLTPPGAPAAGMKSLDQVEPAIPINATNTPGDPASVFIINSPGSYYLTGPLTGVAGRSGLTITASNVTVDLRGYSVIGTTGANTGIDFGLRDRVTVRNGVVRGWPAGGIIGSGTSARLTGLTVELNTGPGIVTGEGAQIVGCVARDNSGTASGGINAGLRSIIQQCTATRNGHHGILFAAESLISECVASNNTGGGIIGSSAAASRVAHCTASNNGSIGIVASGRGCLVESCLAQANGGAAAISIGTDGVVRNCTATDSAAGILLNGRGLATGNYCAFNDQGGTGAGIRIDGTNNRVEGNTCSFNGRGFVSVVGPNLVIRNSAHGHASSYVLVGDGAGPIVSAANVATDTRPHANFAF